VADKVFQPGSVDYDGAIAASYSSARSYSVETASLWTAVVEPFIAKARPATVLDVGCGTGRFSSLFAERFQARVIGLDPAVAMLRAATNARHRDNLFYAAARGEEIPLRDNCCDLAWLSQVIHHIKDRKACARELRRVLRPGGHVLIRGAFADRLDAFPTLLRFFPGTREFMLQFPTVEQVLADFRSAGFSLERTERIRQQTCDNLAEFAERTRLRADSTLSLLPDAEFERCQAELERAARDEPPEPVIEIIELLVLRAHTTEL
jgi:ubiquinone/menaquinone biosynthesis C-methylase UbiE